MLRFHRSVSHDQPALIDVLLRLFYSDTPHSRRRRPRVVQLLWNPTRFQGKTTNRHLSLSCFVAV
jgi:hypothetical protein